MLKAMEKEDKRALLDFLGGGIISVRISSYISAYGFDREFVKFWASMSENDIKAVISQFENTLLIEMQNDADTDEIIAFVAMLSPETISCTKETADKLGFTDFIEKQGYKYSGNFAAMPLAEEISEVDIKEVYTLISDNIPNSFPSSKEAYLSFLSDYTYRKRRGFARGKCIHENERIVSCAVTSAESQNEALLSGVACDKNLRKGGYGKRTVLTLANELKNENKEVYVIALNESAQGFYEHIGFKKDKTIAYIERKSNV